MKYHQSRRNKSLEVTKRYFTKPMKRPKSLFFSLIQRLIKTIKIMIAFIIINHKTI